MAPPNPFPPSGGPSSSEPNPPALSREELTSRPASDRPSMASRGPDPAPSARAGTVDASGRLRPAGLAGRSVPPRRRETRARAKPERPQGPWEESLPLLLFGGTCLGLAVYSYLFHTGAFGTRIPLWIYFSGLGAIAVGGGVAAAAVHEDTSASPRPGDRVGEGMVAVPAEEWEAMRSTVRAVRPFDDVARGPMAPPPGAPLSRPTAPPPRPSPPSRPRELGRPEPSTAKPPTDWWENAVEQARKEGVLEGLARDRRLSEADLAQVLETLDALARGATPRPPPTAPSVPRHGPPHRPSRAHLHERRPIYEETERDHEAPAPFADGDRPVEALDALASELATIVRRRPPVPAPTSAEGTCAACGRTLDPHGRSGAGACGSCGRPLCKTCAAGRQGPSGEPLCEVCSMLLDGAGA